MRAASGSTQMLYSRAGVYVAFAARWPHHNHAPAHLARDVRPFRQGEGNIRERRERDEYNSGLASMASMIASAACKFPGDRRGGG